MVERLKNSYIRSGISIPSNPVAERITRATSDASRSRMARTA